jgi:hypothetical protein
MTRIEEIETIKFRHQQARDGFPKKIALTQYMASGRGQVRNVWTRNAVLDYRELLQAQLEEVHGPDAIHTHGNVAAVNAYIGQLSDWIDQLFFSDPELERMAVERVVQNV